MKLWAARQPNLKVWKSPGVQRFVRSPLWTAITYGSPNIFTAGAAFPVPLILAWGQFFSASSKWELFSWSKYTRHFHPWLYWFPPQREQHKTIQFYRLAHLLSPSALCGCDSVHILLLHRIYWLCPLSKTSEDAIPVRMHHCKSLRKGALDFSICFLKVHSCLHFSMDTAQTSKQPSKSACSDILHWPYSTPRMCLSVCLVTLFWSSHTTIFLWA